MSTALFEQHVLSKPYFDRAGLILALENEKPLGFVHVGFGANSMLDELNRETAVVSMLMVSKSSVPDATSRSSLACSLLEQAEAYAKEHQAQTIFGGGSYPNNPFYLGLYGGSRLPGILAEDEFTTSIFEQRGFQEQSAIGIWQIELAGFRTIVNREQMQIRRRFNIRAEFDPHPRSWWEACTMGHAERMKFELVDRSTEAICGEVTFWDMQPLARDWGVHAAGMFDIMIDPDVRRGGMATFLIGESLRQLKDHGSTVAEVQTNLDDEASIGLFQKLGFAKIDQGVLFSKAV